MGAGGHETGENNGGKRGADRHMHAYRLGNIEGQEHEKQHWHDDDPAAHAKQAGNDAGDGTRRDQYAEQEQRLAGVDVEH